MNIVYMDEVDEFPINLETLEENKLYKNFYLVKSFENDYGKCKVYKNKKGVAITQITTKSFKSFEELKPNLKEVIERLKGRKYE